MFHRPVRIFGCFQCSIRFARNVNFNRYSDRTASERNVLFTEYTCQSIGLIRPRKRVDGETTLRNLTHARAEYNKTECSSPIHVHVCRICVCVCVCIYRFSRNRYRRLCGPAINSGTIVGQRAAVSI